MTLVTLWLYFGGTVLSIKCHHQHSDNANTLYVICLLILLLTSTSRYRECLFFFFFCYFSLDQWWSGVQTDHYTDCQHFQSQAIKMVCVTAPIGHTDTHTRHTAVYKLHKLLYAPIPAYPHFFLFIYFPSLLSRYFHLLSSLIYIAFKVTAALPPPAPHHKKKTTHTSFFFPLLCVFSFYSHNTEDVCFVPVLDAKIWPIFAERLWGSFYRGQSSKANCIKSSLHHLLWIPLWE